MAAANAFPITIEYIRLNKLPANREQMTEYEKVIDEYAKSIREIAPKSPETEWLDASIAINIADWKKYAAKYTSGEKKDKDSATYWVIHGEGKHGIIADLENLLNSALRMTQ